MKDFFHAFFMHKQINHHSNSPVNHAIVCDIDTPLYKPHDKTVLVGYTLIYNSTEFIIPLF